MILTVQLEERSYDIVIERGALQKVGERIPLDRRVLIITDEGVPAVYAKTVAEQCKNPVVVTVPQGEDSKSVAQWEKLLTVMLENGFTRRDCVVAVGGGVVGDLSGFAAASYMRGVDFYNIPTTTLSQIDSSIGGKVAVNLAGIKNIVGAFHQPKKVIIDPEVLATLPKRQIVNGLAEAVKMALTSDAELFALFENEDPFAVMDTVIMRSLMIKKHVVEQDEKEMGLRKILNFGHTIGHGIESEEGLHGYYHGECVALGMLPMCAPAVRERLLTVLQKLELPTEYRFSLEKINAAMMHDKKSEGDTIIVTTVEEPGSFTLSRITYDELGERLNVFMRGNRT